jgi:hypothetical protein
MKFSVLLSIGIHRLACQAWTAIGLFFKVPCAIVYENFFSCSNILASNDGKPKAVSVFNTNILNA